MSKIISLIRKNKLTTLLLLIVVYFVFNSFKSNFSSRSYEYSPRVMSPQAGVSNSQPDSALNLNQNNRMVVQESYLSLLVKDVRSTQNQIVKKAQEMGGYMVNTNIQNPSDAATATVIIRIPAKNLNEALEYFRSLSVKVTSENLQGTDVTDQYVDLKARMDTLLATKTKLESILEKATQVADILNVQRELINLQSQIDNLKGQQDYLSKNAQAAKITVYLSTDELSLPYAPSDSWRPEVIMKEAVRSLILTFRNIGSILIWVLVYSIIWVPILLVLVYYKRRKKSLQNTA